MEKEFIPHEEALALKELGFDEPCILLYRDLDTQPVCQIGYEFKTEKNSNYNDETNYWLTVPTYSQAFRWFREKHNLHSHISLGISDEQDRSKFEYDEYTFVIEGVKELDFNNYGEESFYKTPEEAELACLKKLIEIVKEK